MDGGQNPESGDREPAGEEDRRPTPVRMVMEGMEQEGGEGEARERELSDPDTGREWVVTVVGRAVSGVLPLRIIPLMELNFFLAEEPGTPLRRAVCRGDDLSHLTDSELLALLRRAEPYRDPRNSGGSSTDDPRRSGKGRKDSRG